MTEEQWPACVQPLPMEQYLEGAVSDRKARLYVCACSRLIWDLLTDPRSREAVEVAERLADSDDTEEQRRRAYRRAMTVAMAGGGCYDVPFVPTCALRAEPSLAHMGRSAANHSDVGEGTFCDLLRELFGNPFRPVTPLRAAWLTPAVVAVARAAYDDRAMPSGHLDGVRLGVLADALEEAGCDSGELLTHLRSSGPHVRGCWALDLVLGKK